MRKLVLRFLNDDGGTTAIEYGLIAAGISVAIIVAVNTLGTNLKPIIHQHFQPAEVVSFLTQRFVQPTVPNRGLFSSMTKAAGSGAPPGGGLKLGAARVPRNLIPRALS